MTRVESAGWEYAICGYTLRQSKVGRSTGRVMTDVELQALNDQELMDAYAAAAAKGDAFLADRLATELERRELDFSRDKA